MVRKLRSKLTYANVIATLALFVALGGSSYAAIKITSRNVPKNALTGADIKNLTGKDVRDNTLTGADIKKLTGADVANGELLAEDFAPGQLPAGAKGDQGPQGAEGDKGDTGAPGSTVGFAFVTGSGTVNEEESANVTDANVRRAAAGVYCIGGLPFTPRSAQVTIEAASSTDIHDRIGQVLIAGTGTTPFGCNAGETARVHTVDLGLIGATAEGLADTFFTVWFED